MILGKVNNSASKVIIILLSQAWMALISIVFLPLYIRIIGVESYGLVAFYTTLNSSLIILDLGLSASVSRRLAMMKADGTPLAEQRNLLFSIEIIYGAIALLIGFAIILLAYPITHYWIKSEHLSPDVISRSVMLMGICFAFQWPVSVYMGALTGMQRQISNAFIMAGYATARALIMILALKFVSGTIICFFVVQIIMNLLQILAYRFTAWKELVLAHHRPRFSKQQVLQIRKFAMGMTGISIVSFMLSQVDKIVVSKLVLLEYVGYYNLAFALAGMINQVVAPMQNIFFPKFSSYVAANEETALSNSFHYSARWVSIIVIPVGLTFVLFSKEILMLWTKNPVLTEKTSPILQFATLGTMFNCLMWVPYYYMLAKGITKYSIYQNIIATLIMTPLLFWWTSKYGVIGASLVWFTVNLGTVIISLPIIHYLYFKGNLKKWYINNLLSPVIVSAPLLLLAKMIFLEFSLPVNYLTFILCMVIVFSVYSLITKEIRPFIFRFYTQLIHKV